MEEVICHRRGKTLLGVLGIIVMVSLLLQGCGGAAPTASPPKSEAPTAVKAEATREPAKAESTKAPAATQPAKPAAASSAPIKIALVAPLTGDFAALGKMVKQGIGMALEEINGKGGVNGRKIEIIEEDAGSSNTTALNALNKVLEQKPVAVIAGTSSAMCMAMTPVADKEGVPFLVMGTVPGLFEQGSKWLFGMNPPDNIGAVALTKYAVEKLGAKKVGLIVTNEESGQSIIAVVRNTLKAYNQDLILELHGPGDKDMSAQLLNVKNKGAEALLVWSYPQTGPLIAKQAKQLRIDLPMLTNFAGYAQSLALLTNEEAAGLIGSTFAAPAWSEEPAVKAWVKSFKEKYNQDPDGSQSHPYDALMILAKVIGEKGDSREAVRQGLLAVKGYKGVSGEWSFNEKGIGRHDVVAVQVQNDKSVKIIGIIKAEN